MRSCLAKAAAGIGQSQTVVDRAACRTHATASNHTAQLWHLKPQNQARLLTYCSANTLVSCERNGVVQPSVEWQQHGCAGPENCEQRPWLPQQHYSLLQQLQEPAQQLLHALSTQRHTSADQEHATYLSGGRHDRQMVVAAAVAGPSHVEDDDGAASISSSSSSSSSASHVPSSSASERKGVSDSSLSTVMRERMRQRLATRLTKSAHPEQGSEAKAAAAAAAQSTAAPAPAPDALAASIAEAAAAAANRGGKAAASHRSNDSSIGDILQQLQLKLGPQYSKPGSAASAKAIGSDSNNMAAGAPQPQQPQQLQPVVNSSSAAAADAAASASSRRRLRHQQQLKDQQQKEHIRQHQKTQLKEQRAAAFQQLQVTADVLLKQRPTSATSAGSKAAVHNRSSSRVGTASSKKNASSSRSASQAGPSVRPRTRRRVSNSVTTAAQAADSVAEAAANGSQDMQGSGAWDEESLGPLPPGAAAIVASSAAPVAVQQHLLRSLAAGHNVPRNCRTLARRLMHFDEASQLLGGPERAASILERDSTLMLMAPAVLQRKLERLQQLLASMQAAGPLDGGDVSSSSSNHSSSVLHSRDLSTALVTTSSSSSSSSGDKQFHVSAEVLGLLRSHPGLLRLSAAGLEQRLASLQAALGLGSKQEVLQVVRWQPRVLSMNETALQDKVWGLAAAVRVPPASIQSLFVRQPLLLNLSADTLARKAASLSSSLGLAPQQLWEMLQCKPGVLLFSSVKVSRKWTLLKRLAASHPRWRSELTELSPSSLVQLLTASEPRLARLQHIVAVGSQEEQSLYYTVTQQTDARFRAKFRQYGRWLIEQKTRGPAVATGVAASGA